MMYRCKFFPGNECEMLLDQISLIAIVKILEKSKTPFQVFLEGSQLEPQDFDEIKNPDYYRHWLKRKAFEQIDFQKVGKDITKKLVNLCTTRLIDVSCVKGAYSEIGWVVVNALQKKWDEGTIKILGEKITKSMLDAGISNVEYDVYDQDKFTKVKMFTTIGEMAVNSFTSLGEQDVG